MSRRARCLPELEDSQDQVCGREEIAMIRLVWMFLPKNGICGVYVMQRNIVNEGTGSGREMES